LKTPLDEMLKSAKQPLKFLCENIEKSLMEVGCTQAAYFGSVATNTVDQYSDVDLIICGDTYWHSNLFIV